MSLNAVHAGIIWTGIVLIGALLAYYFIYDYPYEHRYNHRYSRFNGNYMQYRFYRFMNPPIKYRDNKPVSISIIVCCWFFPLFLTDYVAVPLGYSLTGHLGIAGIIKMVVALISVVCILIGSNYIIQRGYRINALLLRLYSAFMLIYGLYVGYNVIGMYYDLYRLKTMF